MEKNKLLATAASILIQCTGGASYTFGIYSAVLKSSQGYDQSTLDTVSVFKDIGANIGILSGFLYDGVVSGSIPSWSRFRSRLSVVYLAGAVQCFIGYFLMWLSVNGVIHRPNIVFMCFFMFIASHAQTFFNTVNVVVAVQNFPDYGGTSIGIMKGFLGLSGAILIQIYLTFFNGEPTKFILMLAILPSLTAITFMCKVQENPSNTTNDKHHLKKFYIIAIAIALYLTILLILDILFVFPLWARILKTTILLILIATPFLIPLTSQNNEKPESPSNSTTTTPLMASEAQDDASSLETDPLTESESQGDKVQVELSLLQSLKTVKFWLLFLSMVCAMGSGLSTINNVTQIGESMNYTPVQINAVLSLWSIWNFFGRFGGGFVSDLALHKLGWARPLFISLTLAAMVVGHLIIGLYECLYFGTFIVGICYGSQWSLMPTISSEIFGVKNMGTIFNAIAAANPFGSYVFSVLVIGRIYDKESGGGSCFGIHCFMDSFIVFAGVCCIGFVVSLVLFFRTKGVYEKVLEKRSNRVEGE